MKVEFATIDELIAQYGNVELEIISVFHFKITFCNSDGWIVIVDPKYSGDYYQYMKLSQIVREKFDHANISLKGKVMFYGKYR